MEVFLTAPPPPPPPNELLVLNDENGEFPFIGANISSKLPAGPNGLNAPNGLNRELTCVLCPLRDPRLPKPPENIIGIIDVAQQGLKTKRIFNYQNS